MNEYPQKRLFSNQFSAQEGVNDEEQVYQENPYLKNTKKHPTKTISKNSKSSLIKKPTKTAAVSRPKSRLAYSKGNGAGESAFPALHQNTNSKTQKKTAQLGYETLPDFYNKNEQQHNEKYDDEIAVNYEDNEDLYFSQNISKNSGIPIESTAPSPIRVAFREDLQQKIQESNEQIQNDFENIIFDSLNAKEEEEEEKEENFEIIIPELSNDNLHNSEEERHEKVIEENEKIESPHSDHKKDDIYEEKPIQNSEYQRMKGRKSKTYVDVSSSTEQHSLIDENGDEMGENEDLNNESQKPNDNSKSIPILDVYDNYGDELSVDMSANIPERLLEMIGDDRTSLSYLALCGSPLDGYESKKIRQAMNQLKVYLNKCVNLGYIYEARFVEETIVAVNEAYKESLTKNDIKSIYVVEDQISSTEAEMTQKSEFFINHAAKMNADKDLQLRELKFKLDEDLNELDRLWTSEEQAQKYSKVSSKLRQTRKEAANLLAAKRYDEAEIVAEQANQLAEEEAQEATRKMHIDYMKAIQKRKEKYENDKAAIDDAYERKKATLLREKKKVESILNNRLDKLITRKDKLENKFIPKSQQRHAQTTFNSPRNSLGESRSFNLSNSRRQSRKPSRAQSRATSKPRSSALTAYPSSVNMSRNSAIPSAQSQTFITDIQHPNTSLPLKPLKRMKRPKPHSFA